MISIDPGITTGWARWQGKGGNVLHSCGLGPVQANDDFAVIERPTIYPRSPVPPNDIVKLAINAGSLSAQFPRVLWILPRTWKGTTPKRIMGQRILASLNAFEIDIYERTAQQVSPGARHNILDAIGIGLYHLNRLVG